MKNVSIRGKTRELICFDDKLLRLIGIPFLGILMPIAFHGLNPFEQPAYILPNFAVGIIISFVLWHINRAIILSFRNRLENYSETGKRLILQFLSITLFTLAFSFMGILLAEYVIPLENRISRPPKVSVYFSNLLISYIVSIIYESVYFAHRWKESILETERLKTENYHSQLETLKSRVNPHFLFNSLNTLASIIPEQPKLAIEFVQELSNAYRYILELKDKEVVTLKQELDCTKSYVFLLKIRFGDNLQVTFDLPKANLKDHVPPLSLQILIENAVKHNIVSQAKPLTIRIELSKDGAISVSNNLQLKRSQVLSTKTGHNNIIKRYKLLSDQKVRIIQTTNNYIVLIPLLKIVKI